MGDERSRAGAANLSVPLMIVAFVLIAAFLWWLSITAESNEIVVDEGPDAAQNSEVVATEVTAEQLRLQPEQLEGQAVRVSRVDVATAVGSQAFFLDLPQSPFLVKLDETLVQRGQTVPQGTVTVVGTVRAMTDSIVQDWLGRNVIPEGDVLLVEFATHFIEASSVEVTQREAPGEG